MGFFSKAARVGERKTQQISGSGSTVDFSDWYPRNGYYFDGPLFGTHKSLSGASVNAQTALELSACYACVKIIGEDTGTMPLFFYRKSGNGLEVNKAVEHRNFYLLRSQPNPDQSAGEFIEGMTATAALCGQSFAKIENFNGGKSMFIRSLYPDESVRVAIDNNRRIYYAYKVGNTAEKELTRNEIFHLRGFTFNSVEGDQVLSRARQVIGLNVSVQNYASTFTKNDVSSGLFFEHPGALGDEGVQNVLDGWQDKQGPQNAGSPTVLREGMKATRKDPDLQSQQHIETRKFGIEDIARIWRIPLHKLAHLDKMSFNNIEELSIDYIQHTLNPWIRRWREAVHRHLLTLVEQVELRYYAEHSVEAFLRGDFEKQTTGFGVMLEKGVYSINEVRRWMNLNPVEGGDEHHIQLNMTDVNNLARKALDLMGEVKAG